MDSEQLRSRNIDIYDRLEMGDSVPAVARAYGLSERTVRNIRQRLDGEAERYADNGKGGTARASTQEIGGYGLSAWGNIIAEDTLKELRGLEGVKRYKEMGHNSPIAGGMLFAVQMLMRQMDWYVEEDRPEEGAEEDSEEYAQDAPEDVEPPEVVESGDVQVEVERPAPRDERAVFIEQCMDDMSHSWNDFISEVLTFLQYGWAYFEIVYKYRKGDAVPKGTSPSKYDDGRLGWRKLAMRSQDTLREWRFDDTGGLAGMQQILPGATTPWIEDRMPFIPIEKALLFRTRTEKNNPEGQSILRAAWTPYYYVKNLQSIEAIGIERDIAGLPVMWLHRGATSADFAEAEKLVRRVRNDEQAGLVFPGPRDEWDFELLASSGSRLFDVNQVIERHEKRMLMSIMAQLFILGMDGAGSLALSQTQSDLFKLAIDGFADIIADTLNRFAVPRLLALNGFDTRNAPRIMHSPAAEGDLAQMATTLATLVNANLLTPDVAIEQRVREATDMPPLDARQVAERKAQAQEDREFERQMKRASVMGVEAKQREDDKPDKERGQFSDWVAGLRDRLAERIANDA